VSTPVGRGADEGAHGVTGLKAALGSHTDGEPEHMLCTLAMAVRPRTSVKGLYEMKHVSPSVVWCHAVLRCPLRAV